MGSLIPKNKLFITPDSAQGINASFEKMEFGRYAFHGLDGEDKYIPLTGDTFDISIKNGKISIAKTEVAKPDYSARRMPNKV